METYEKCIEIYKAVTRTIFRMALIQFTVHARHHCCW